MSATISANPTAQWVNRSCNICEAGCGLRVLVDVEARQLLRIEGDPDDARSQGYLCPKSQALKGIYDDPDRIRRPLRKNASGGWDEIGWEEAFEFASRRIVEIREAHGAQALGAFIGNPISQDAGAMLYTSAFLRSLGTPHIFTGATMDHFAKLVSSRALYGRAAILPIPDIDRCDYFLCLGANPIVSNGSLMGTPDVKRRLREVRERGKLVVIDPRRSETARAADEHHFIVPGTDALLLFAMLHTLFEEDLVELGHLGDIVDGVDELRLLAEPFSPEAVEKITCIDAAVTRRLTREYATAERACLYGRIGTCTVDFGTLSSWLIDVIGILSGHFDTPGGMMFPRPPTGELESGGETGEFVVGRWRSGARGFPEINGQLSCALLAEEIDEAPDDQRVRAMITVAANPVLTAPNGERVDRALASLDFMVAIDIYLNETTRHADLILPNIAQIEREHFDMFTAVSSRNFVRYSPAILPADPGNRELWDVLFELAARIEGRSRDDLDREILTSHARRLLARDDSPARGTDFDEAMEMLGDTPGPMRLIDLMLRAGPYGDGFDDDDDGLSLAKVKARPGTRDLGPLDSRLASIIRSPGKRIPLAHPYIVQDVPRLRERLEADPGPRGFLLIGRRQIQNMNSHLHNLPVLAKGRARCTLLIHSDDARRLGLSTGSLAKLNSRVGELRVPVQIDDDMMPGVVSLPHGYGHRGEGLRIRVATERQAGVNSNALTDELPIDPISGSCVANGIPVEISAA
jgi:anaerobic selenocysteine-containing dehydrogenase